MCARSGGLPLTRLNNSSAVLVRDIFDVGISSNGRSAPVVVAESVACTLAKRTRARPASFSILRALAEPPQLICDDLYISLPWRVLLLGAYL